MVAWLLPSRSRRVRMESARGRGFSKARAAMGGSKFTVYSITVMCYNAKETARGEAPSVKTLIVDYGMGNLHSVQKALGYLGEKSELCGDADKIARAGRIILPGVGAFNDAMAELTRLALMEPLLAAAARGVPILGICLGMQLLFGGSEEGGAPKGLGILPGRITRLNADGLKIPHMGWNAVENRDPVFFAGLPQRFWVYFVHSFCFADIGAPFCAGVAGYGAPFAAAVRRDNVFGAQFHPEKSGDAGLLMLRNFLNFGGGSSC
jgi:glutamine amidotransferase